MEIPMAEQDLTIQEVKKLATEAGLTRLTDEHLQQLLRATNAARARRASLAADLGPADEPAHVYTLDTGGPQ
jgi:hypothetical protein